MPTTHASELFDVVGEGAPVGLAFVDSELRFVRINAALAAINGRPIEHHIGRRVDEALPELGDRLMPIYRQVLASGEPVFERELTAETPDTGRARHVLASWFPVREGERIAGVGVAVVDITARKAAELRLEGVLRQLPVGVVIADVDGRVLLRNERLHEMGLPVTPPGARIDEADFVAWHSDGRRYDTADWPLVRSLKRGDVVRGAEMEYVDRTGARRAIVASSGPIRDAGGGIVAAVVVIEDVTERRRASERQELLVRAAEVLDSAVGVDERLDRFARLLVPRIADYVKIELLEDAGGRRPVAIAHQDPEREALMRAWRARGRMGEDERVGMATTFATGEAKLLPEIATEAVVRSARRYTGEEGAELMRAIGPRSQIVVPLRARGRVLGALSLTMAESERRYTGPDLELARELGLRAGLAVDNARLYEEAQLRAQQLDALAAASLAMHRTRDLRGRLQLIADHARTLVGARRAVASVTVADERLLAFAPAGESGEPEPDAATLSAPLVTRDGGEMGRIHAIGKRPGGFVAPDGQLLGELARIGSLALENARLADRQRHIARTLQSSLLPPSLPDIPGLQAAARYLPGGEGTTVGGDLYDLFPVDGEWALVVGDVCGKGAEAAALTTMVRFTVRAEVVHHTSPGEVLDLLNAAILRQYRDVRFSTVLHGRVRMGPAGARATLASAGHPPPFLLRCGGGVEAVECGGPLLGVIPDVRHVDATVELRPGDALVCYTDGVTESRRRGELYGDDRLAALLADCVADDAATIAARVTDAVLDFRDGRMQDDLALLVLRVPENG